MTCLVEIQGLNKRKVTFDKTKKTMKKLTFLMVIAVLTAFLLPGCVSKVETTVSAEDEINMDSVRMQIEGLEANYARASNAKDVDGVAAYFANDAQSMPPDEPTLVGMDAIKVGIKREMDMDTSGTTMTLKTLDVWAYGKYATETGTWTNADSTGNVTSTGKYMTLFELRDGKYVAIRDIWNDDKK